MVKRNYKYKSINEISVRMNRSYNTLITYARDRNFPMEKNWEGVWTATEGEIADWLEAQKKGEWYEKPEKKAKKASKKVESE